MSMRRLAGELGRAADEIAAGWERAVTELESAARGGSQIGGGAPVTVMLP